VTASAPQPEPARDRERWRAEAIRSRTGWAQIRRQRIRIRAGRPPLSWHAGNASEDGSRAPVRPAVSTRALTRRSARRVEMLIADVIAVSGPIRQRAARLACRLSRNRRITQRTARRHA
jgi:hypothetical protein